MALKEEEAAGGSKLAGGSGKNNRNFTPSHPCWMTRTQSKRAVHSCWTAEWASCQQSLSWRIKIPRLVGCISLMWSWAILKSATGHWPLPLQDGTWGHGLRLKFAFLPYLHWSMPQGFPSFPFKGTVQIACPLESLCFETHSLGHESAFAL
jgi:hypothetical protein